MNSSAADWNGTRARISSAGPMKLAKPTQEPSSVDPAVSEDGKMASRPMLRP
jgi:hypothetical protein